MDSERPPPLLVIGMDVGGTNTDAVLWSSDSVLASVKVPNRVNYGVEEAIQKLRRQHDLTNVKAVFLGTTAFVNALLEGRCLDRVAVVRLCGPSSRSLPPFCDFALLKDVVSAGTWFAMGGLRFDGSEECRLSEAELERIASEIASSGAQQVVVSGTFSPSDPSQEERAAHILRTALADERITVTVSSRSGQLGLLARENSAILNACLHSTAHRLAARVRYSLHKAGIARAAKLYFTCNDGSVMSFAKAAQSPLRCVQCGPTNSLRGAAYLVSNRKKDEGISTNTHADTIDRIVLDVGGTSTDAGCLVRGVHPRDSNAEATVAGMIRCNHRTTDVVSIALGGGSIVSQSDQDGQVIVGPNSVGADITTKALCFGGTVCTATCIAVAMGASAAWSKNSEEQVMPNNDFDAPSFATEAWNIIQKRLYELVERTRTDKSPVEVVLVGGGACLVDAERLSKALGGCRVVRPQHGSVANACGSALAQNVGEAETIADLSGSNRETVLSELKVKAQRLAGPQAEVIECEEVPLAYLPGKMTRVFVRAVAPLSISKEAEETINMIDVEDASLVDTSVSEEPETFQRQTAPILPIAPSPPNIVNGVWTISGYDAHCLAIGCGILGCGGGGSTYHGKLQLLLAIREKQPIRVVSVDDIPPDAVVAPCGFMGAPSVSLESIGGADQVEAAVRHSFELKSLHTTDPKLFLTVSEVGGSNGIMPLLVGGLMDLPVVDADLMGRAFPEIQMTTTSIYGLSQTPVTLSDSFGRCVTVTGSRTCGDLTAADNDYWAERVLRPVCIVFGCSAGLADPLVTGSELLRVGVRGSLTRARRIGDCVLRAGHPGEAVERMLELEGGKCIFRGMVSDVTRETTGGFAVGTLTIGAEDKSSSMTIQFQNEFLIARRAEVGCNPVVEGCVPDIISILDIDNAHPVATEEIRFGLRVCVILLPVSVLLRTEEALRFVGPAAFGLGESYKRDLYQDRA
jgi:DUF917 family protein/N-methylhydantoinase A/oxoprolinase/acetone carboxylase beta subunit